MRHGRQVRLAEVGEAGQNRIAGARVAVAADGFVGDIATRYLAGAGCGSLRVKSPVLAAAARATDPSAQVAIDPSLDVEPETTIYPWRRRAAAELGTGAHLALRVLRDLLRGSA
jgi:hypothetical protein